MKYNRNKSEHSDKVFWRLKKNISIIMLTLVIILHAILPLSAFAERFRERPRGIENELLRKQKYCSAVRELAFDACQNEARENYSNDLAKCVNYSDKTVRSECLQELSETNIEGTELCRKQRIARKDICTSLGEGRYDPIIEPKLFENNYSAPLTVNKYFPLAIGNQWTYKEPEGLNVINSLDIIKIVNGVPCTVFQDQAFENKMLVEDTDDWFCQAKTGDVYYGGEEVKNYESFTGDKPVAPELISIDGSFKHGRDNDKGGIIMPANPKKGDVYREEFSLGNAEDVAEVLSHSYDFGAEPELDRYVPKELVELLCANDCVVTKNTSPAEPGIVARKYYAPGIGFFLEVKLNSGQTVELSGCNFDARCSLIK
jgi:hypothetical protein